MKRGPHNTWAALTRSQRVVKSSHNLLKLPPGPARLATSPSLTGSSLTMKTMGMVVVAALAANAAAAIPVEAITADIANLITEVERAAITSAEAAERARLHDPALSRPMLLLLGAPMEDACFARDRMHEAVRRLGARLREVKAQEPSRGLRRRPGGA